ncbi:DUF6542 domain-containing protein [Gordonia terrae]
MSSPQRLQTAVPLDQQSVLPAVRGVPWWGAVLLGTGITALGAAIDAGSNDSLGSIYKFCYLVGCVIAALAVRRRALFTAAAQPPLIAFFVSILTLYGINSDQASSGLKSLIFNVLLPIAADFPWMLTTFLTTLALVLARWFLTRGPGKSGKGGTPNRDKSGRNPASRATADSSTDRQRGRATSHRRAKGGGTSESASDAPSASTPSAKSPTSRPAPKTQAAKTQSPGSRPRPRTNVASDRPSPTSRSAGGSRSTPGGQRPAVADLGAPDLTPSDAAPATPRRSDIPTYESATDIPPAGVADTRS